MFSGPGGAGDWGMTSFRGAGGPGFEQGGTQQGGTVSLIFIRVVSSGERGGQESKRGMKLTKYICGIKMFFFFANLVRLCGVKEDMAIDH